MNVSQTHSARDRRARGAKEPRRETREFLNRDRRDVLGGTDDPSLHNAGRQPLPKAAATQERRPQVGGCTPLLGGV